MKELLNFLNRAEVQMWALILAPFAVTVGAALILWLRNFLRRKFPQWGAIIDEAAKRGLVYAEQLSKTTGIKREEKLNMAADVACRYAKQRYGITLPREAVVDAIEFFLGILTIESLKILQVEEVKH